MSVFKPKYTMTKINSSENDIPIANIPIISENCRITDTRMLKDFKDQTFGGYNIVQSISALDKALIEDKLEPSLHWGLQLFLSGLINSLWIKLISKRITWIRMVFNQTTLKKSYLIQSNTCRI